jgi:ribosomal protein L13
MHTERLIHKMLPLNETHRQEIEKWTFYRGLSPH